MDIPVRRMLMLYARMLVDVEETTRTKSSAAHLQLPSGSAASGAIVQTSSATVRVVSKWKRAQICSIYFQMHA